MRSLPHLPPPKRGGHETVFGLIFWDACCLRLASTITRQAEPHIREFFEVLHLLKRELCSTRSCTCGPVRPDKVLQAAMAMRKFRRQDPSSNELISQCGSLGFRSKPCRGGPNRVLLLRSATTRMSRQVCSVSFVIHRARWLTCPDCFQTRIVFVYRRPEDRPLSMNKALYRETTCTRLPPFIKRPSSSFHVPPIPTCRCCLQGSARRRSSGRGGSTGGKDPVGSNGDDLSWSNGWE